MRPEELTVLSKLMLHVLRLEREEIRKLEELRQMKQEIYTIGIRLQGAELREEVEDA